MFNVYILCFLHVSIFYVFSSGYLITRKSSGDIIQNVKNCTFFGGKLDSGNCTCVGGGTFVINTDERQNKVGHICISKEHYKLGVNTRLNNQDVVFFVPYNRNNKTWSFMKTPYVLTDGASGECVTVDICNASQISIVYHMFTRNNNKKIVISSMDIANGNHLGTSLGQSCLAIQLKSETFAYETVQGELLYIELRTKTTYSKCYRKLVLKFEGNRRYLESKYRVEPDGRNTNEWIIIISSITAFIGVILILTAFICLIKLRRREKLNLVVPPPYQDQESNDVATQQQYANQGLAGVNENIKVSPIYETISDIVEQKHKQVEREVTTYENVNEQEEAVMKTCVGNNNEQQTENSLQIKQTPFKYEDDVAKTCEGSNNKQQTENSLQTHFKYEDDVVKTCEGSNEKKQQTEMSTPAQYENIAYAKSDLDNKTEIFV